MMEEKVKVYRLYVDDECVGTYGDGSAAMVLALRDANKWLSFGYKNIDIKREAF